MTETPCQHLEALIQPKRTGPLFESVNTYVGDCDNRAEPPPTFIVPEGMRDRSYEMTFRNKLSKYIVDQIKIDILVLRYIYEQSFKEIAEELGVLSITTAVRLHSEAIELLKKKGFGSVRKTR